MTEEQTAKHAYHWRQETVSFQTERIPNSHLRIGSAEAHFWLAPLDVVRDEAAELSEMLSPDERARAERFRAPRDRSAFTVARGRLRLLLAAYVSCAPQDIEFTYDGNGKPALAGDTDRTGALQFNVSHTEGVALFGVTRGRHIGVDIECVRADLAFQPLARRFFAPEEVSAIESLPAADQVLAFYAVWTRKEAFLKATGDGLQRDLKSFAVSVNPGEAPSVVRDDRELPGAALRLVDLQAPMGCVAAAALGDSVESWHGWRWGSRVLGESEGPD